MNDTFPIVARYADGVAARGLWPVLGLAVPALGWLLWRARGSLPMRWVPVSVLVLAMCVGVGSAVHRASLFDDAFISCRYAQNFLEGHGLVWNPGERVEGYTNFLWTMLIALGAALTGAEAPAIALGLSLSAFVLGFVVVFRLGRAVAAPAPAAREALTGAQGAPREGALYVPIAVALLAVQHTYVDYGTTGMETLAASALVNLGALFLVARDDARGAALAGASFIVATLAHPDHAIFYVIGGGVIVAFRMRALARARAQGVSALRRAGVDVLVAYAAPFVGYLGYLAWKVAYYGSVVPNTYYAKSADSTYFEQGFRYALSFYLGTHLWALLPLFVWWLTRPAPAPAAARFKAFTGASFVAYNAYVIKVGGDFMYGRFFLTLLPLLYIAIEGLVLDLGRTSKRPSALIATVAVVTLAAGGVPMIRPRKVEWGIADESTFYQVTQVSPIVVDHPMYRMGQVLRATLTDRGMRPLIASGGIGMIGYYSRLPLLDLHGLTDVEVARMPLRQRGRPGHEKVATRAMLVERGVRLVPTGERVDTRPRAYAALTRVSLGPGTGRPWQIVVYDRALMRRIRAESPELVFTDFEAHLDGYIASLEERDPAAVARDLAWFRAYYFDHNEDPSRLAPIRARAAARVAGGGVRAADVPSGPSATGASALQAD